MGSSSWAQGCGTVGLRCHGNRSTAVHIVRGHREEPQCFAPRIARSIQHNIDVDHYEYLDYHLNEGSQWTYSVEASSEVTVFMLTWHNFELWRKNKNGWNLEGSHVIPAGQHVSKTWHIGQEGRKVLAVKNKKRMWRSRPVHVSMSYDIFRTAHCMTPHAGNMAQCVLGDPRNVELAFPPDGAGIVIRVPEEHAGGQEERLTETWQCLGTNHGKLWSAHDTGFSSTRRPRVVTR